MPFDGFKITSREAEELKIALAKFQTSPLWTAFEWLLRRDRDRIFVELTNKKTPMETLKYNQGELTQVNRDILLCERLTRVLERGGREDLQ